MFPWTVSSLQTLALEIVFRTHCNDCIKLKVTPDEGAKIPLRNFIKNGNKNKKKRKRIFSRPRRFYLPYVRTHRRQNRLAQT